MKVDQAWQVREYVMSEIICHGMPALEFIPVACI